MSDNEIVEQEALLPEVQFTDEPEEPEQRARHRLRRLATSFAEVLATIAQMQRDEDWKYVSREDGTPYSSLADLLRDHMGISVAMARRYVQGARDIYLPLQELVVQGTPIQITAGDVASLGRDGAREVVDTVRQSVTGDETPEEAAELVSESVAQTRAQRESERDGGGDDDSRGRERLEPREGEESAAAQREWEGSGAEPSYDPSEGTVSGADAFAGMGDDDVDYSASSGADLLGIQGEYAGVLDGARTYDTADECDELDGELAEVANALRVLAGMDGAKVAALVSYDSRGVLVPCDEAVTQIYKLRSTVETSSWYMERME